MNSSRFTDHEFLVKLTEIIDANLENPDFGVSELAGELGMSRSNLHRKVHEITKSSVSHFIIRVRLKKAMQMLTYTSGSVSEVAFKTGFNYVSYFTKCFHEEYGIPPGKVKRVFGKENETEVVQMEESRKKKVKAIRWMVWIMVLLAAIAVLHLYLNPVLFKSANLGNSVAILPPSYLGSDSLYIQQVNGAMMIIPDYLSLIGDMDKVIPWISVQKYKNSTMSATEIARELHVKYIVASSGIVLDDTIRINIQLIDGVKGNQIWYYPFEIKTLNFIKLPVEIATGIAREIHVEISSREKSKMEKIYTRSYDAWNSYLIGREQYILGINHYYKKGDAQNRELNQRAFNEHFENAINHFRKALEFDQNFALAYARLAIVYYLMDNGLNEGKYSMEIQINADQAISLDPHHDICLLAKAYQYLNNGENSRAIPVLEKAVLYNPRSIECYRILSNLYNLPREADAEKYLKYKLMVVKLNQNISDSIQKSEDYRLAARALRVVGLYREAEILIERSISFNQENLSSACERAEILVDRERDYPKACEILEAYHKKDSTNLEVLRFLFTNHYLQREYFWAYQYYRKLLQQDNSLSYLPAIDLSRISIMLRQLGFVEEANLYYERFKATDRSNLNSYNLSLELMRMYCLEQDQIRAMEQLRLFSSQSCFFSYSIRMLTDDPVFDQIRELPDFNSVTSDIKAKFQEEMVKLKNYINKEVWLKYV